MSWVSPNNPFSEIEWGQVAALASVYRRLTRRRTHPNGDSNIKEAIQSGFPLGLVSFVIVGKGTLGGIIGVIFISGAILSYNLTGPIVMAQDTEFLVGTSLVGKGAKLASLYYLATEAAMIAVGMLGGVLIATRAENPLFALSSYVCAVLATVAIGMVSLRFRHLRRGTLSVVFGLIVLVGQFTPAITNMVDRFSSVVGINRYIVLIGVVVVILLSILVVGTRGADFTGVTHHRFIRAQFPQLGRFNATSGIATARIEEKLGIQGLFLYVAISLGELLFFLGSLSGHHVPKGAPPGVFLHPMEGFLIASLVVMTFGQFMVTRRTVPGLMEDPELTEWSFLHSTSMPASLIALGFSLPGIIWTVVFGIIATLVIAIIGLGSSLLFSVSILALVVPSGLAVPMVVMAGLVSRQYSRSLILGPVIARLAVIMVELSIGATLFITLGSIPTAVLFASICSGAAIGALCIAGSAVLIRKEFRTLT